MEERIPPHSDDAERSVLGAVMKIKKLCLTVRKFLRLRIFTAKYIKKFLEP